MLSIITITSIKDPVNTEISVNLNQLIQLKHLFVRNKKIGFGIPVLSVTRRIIKDTTAEVEGTFQALARLVALHQFCSVAEYFVSHFALLVAHYDYSIAPRGALVNRFQSLLSIS